MNVVNITTRAEFNKEVINSDKLVLVDFWAQWCPPCRAMAPVLERLADKHAGLSVVKVNVEESAENAALAAEHGVQGIPNMFVYKAGKQVKNIVGMRPAPVLEQDLLAYL